MKTKPPVMYMTTITLKVLSEQMIDGNMSIANIIAECDNGDFVLHTTNQEAEPLTGKEAADALYEAGSEPGFFNLDDDGNSTL